VLYPAVLLDSHRSLKSFRVICPIITVDNPKFSLTLTFYNQLQEKEEEHDFCYTLKMNKDIHTYIHTYIFICSKISTIPTKRKGTELDEKVV